jgi:hypothetical protein
MAKFTYCYKCHVIQPVKALDGGLCWLCAGLRKPPALLRKPPASLRTLAESSPVTMDPDAEPCDMKTGEEMQADIIERLPTPSDEPPTDEAPKAETEA